MYKNEPEWTCPCIDDTIGIIQDTEKTIIRKLEELRTSNDELRAWGRTGYDEAQEHLETISDLEKTISNLESEIQEQSDTICKLRWQLRNYEDGK